MELLLEALLRISRMGRESLQVKQLNMKELLNNVTDNLGFQLNEADVELTIDKLDDCYADAAQMEQVFTNLIANAIKYRAKDRKCKIGIRSEKDEDCTRYYVSDNGIGIGPEHQDRIFHAFYRVDTEITEGDGVGLAIVNRAIDLHNGRVWVESELTKGSKFAIELPNKVEMINGVL
jgi:signal transduction histidine kinase